MNGTNFVIDFFHELFIGTNQWNTLAFNESHALFGLSGQHQISFQSRFPQLFRNFFPIAFFIKNGTLEIIGQRLTPLMTVLKGVVREDGVLQAARPPG
jgi:hypothetical protein